MTDTPAVPKELSCEIVQFPYLCILIPDKVRHTGLWEGKGKGKGFQLSKVF